MGNSVVPNEYLPDHVSPPGETLVEILETIGMTQTQLARRTGRPIKTINEIVQGKASITPETALQLERVLRVPAGFWIRREQDYRESLARQEEDERLSNQVDWLKKVPVKEMVRQGWIRRCEDKIQQLREVLDFFRIVSPVQWDSVYRHASFRQSIAFQANPIAVAAWLREGERRAQHMECSLYNSSTFKAALGKVRLLTMEAPSVFEPEVKRLCADAGVAVVFVPELPKTRVSGATYWLSPDKALIQLSLRYKTNDHLWFTFFHEAGHILLHSKKDTFLEEDSLNSAQEQEANKFAADMLIPPTEWSQLVQRVRALSGQYPNTSAIQEWAEEIGIAPGVLVGRLQHDKLIPPTHYDHLKVRLAWAT